MKNKIFKIGTAIIIENSEKKFLFQLRDDKIEIKYPNHWVLFGGEKENDETPEQAIEREIQEELNLEIGNFEFYKNFEYEDIDEKHFQYVYYKKWDIDTETNLLFEGQKMQYFTVQEIPNLNFGFNMRNVIMTFLKERRL